MAEWERNIRKVEPYVAGEQPRDRDVVKLNTNENPYPPSPRVAEALEKLSADDLRLYPDPTAGKLVRAIAAAYDVDPEQVFVGVGSDDVIAMSFLTFFNNPEGRPVLFPDISYSFYDVWAECFRIPYRKVPLDDDFRIRPEDYISGQEIPENGDGSFRNGMEAGEKADIMTPAGPGAGGIIFPNPNAPTGLAMPVSDIEKIVRANQDVVVIVDEAYVDFGAASSLPLLKKYDNLLVVRTFSKSRSMAGMRIGYAIGNPEIISCLYNVRNSFNSYTMNMPSIEAGTAAMEDEEYFEKTRDKIISTREWAKERLAGLGFVFPDSKANFIFAAHKKVPAKRIFEELRERHIYVRYFEKPRIDNYLRITVGTREQMEKLFEALEEILN